MKCVTNALPLKHRLDQVRPFQFTCQSRPDADTHVSSGFAAQAPQESLDILSTLDATYKPTVDEDTVVSING